MKRNRREKSPTSTMTWIALAVILAAGVALRAAWFNELVESPDFNTPVADAAFHDYWARALTSGDWSVPEGEGDPRIRDVPFLRPPGYSYFLAAVYKLTGTSYSAPRLVQFGLGLLNALLLFLLASALFDRAAGLIAAALSATYWGLLYFEGQLQAPVLIVTLLLLFLLVLQRWMSKRTLLRAAGGGLLLGLLILVSANAILLLPVAAGWIWWASGKTGRTRLFHTIAFTVGTAAAISPATIRNAVVADDFVLVSCNGAVNLHIGNNEGSDGVTTRIPELQELTGSSGWSWFTYDRIVQGIWKKEGRQLKHSEVSAYFTRKALGYIASRPDRFLSLSLKRAALFWGPDEISNNKAIGVEKEKSSILRHLPPFPLMVSLSLAGILLLFTDRRSFRTWASRKKSKSAAIDPLIVLVLLVIVTWFLSYLPFLAAGRFRLPIIPLLFLFAAYGLRGAYLSLFARKWVKFSLLPVTWILLFLVLNVSYAGNEVDLAWWHTDRAVAHMREGEFADAEAEFRAALAANPGYVDARVNFGMLLATTDRYAEAIEQYQNVASHRPDRHDARIMLASLLTSTGRRDEAIDEMQSVIRANPNLDEAHFELGRALIAQDRHSEGIAAIRQCLKLNPGYGEAHANLAAALAIIGNHQDSIAEYRLAIQYAQDSPEIQYQFGNALLAANNLEEAETAFRKAIQLNPEYVEPVIHLGMTFNRSGRREEAIGQFRMAIAMDRRNMTARCNLAGSLANMGRYDESIEALEEALSIEPSHGLARERLEIVRRMKQDQKR